MTTTNTFSLYLAKADVSTFEDLLTDTARRRLDSGSARKVRSDAFGDGGALYTFAGQRKPPHWAEQLKAHFDLEHELWTQSPCAILTFRKDQLLFAITFSYGHVYLDDRRTEAEFGLRAAINFVSDDKLRSVERSNLGDAMREFAQAANQKDLRSFGFDDALDLIRKVTGYASESNFADKVTGSRPLRFSKEIELGGVPEVAAGAFALFQSEAYKQTAFGIIDFLAPVSDPMLESALDQALVVAVQQGSDEFEVSLPEILPEDVGSFRFERIRSNRFYPDLSLELYRESLGDRLKTLCLEELKHHKVAAYDIAGDKPFKTWSVHQALLGSIVRDGERYALNEGAWYRISQAFKDAADAAFVDLLIEPDEKLMPFKKIIAPAKSNKEKSYYQAERSYNKDMAGETGYLLLDERLVVIEGTPGPGIEACDLIDVERRRFIHIKKSSRKSSILSHLFKQGSNSAQLFRKYESFKNGIIENVAKDYGSHIASSLQKAMADRWKVEFQIADFPRENGEHNIPFFSKLTLRDEARIIRAMDFDVGVGFITLTRT